MSALNSVRRVLREYRAEFGLSRLAAAVEFAILGGACLLVLSGGWVFAVFTP